MSKWIRKGDKVVVIAGNSRGKTGEVISRTEERVIVQGINIRKKHAKRRTKAPGAEILEMEMPFHISNVALCNAEGKAVKAKVSRPSATMNSLKEEQPRPTGPRAGSSSLFCRTDLCGQDPAIDQRRQRHRETDQRHTGSKQWQMSIVDPEIDRDTTDPGAGSVAKIEGALVQRRGEIGRIGGGIHHPDLQRRDQREGDAAP